MSSRMFWTLCVLFSFLSPLASEENRCLQHWSFDDAGTQTGVWENAERFPLAKPMNVEMSFLPESGQLNSLCISAWICPERFEKYNEIFRQENNTRILFSLQENATILSLGLNISGYVECDANIDRDRLFDGDWHFVAASFDGKHMRIFFDGTEIGRLERPGTISVQRKPDGFIGSSEGVSEFFVGMIDELQIRDTVLSPQEITDEYRKGIASLEKQNLIAAKGVEKFYSSQNSFFDTLLETRSQFHRLKIAEQWNSGARQALTRKLRVDYEKESQDFFPLTGIMPVDFIVDTDLSRLWNHADVLIKQMVEYKPLTDEQWNYLSSDQRLKWNAVERIQTQFISLSRNENAESVRELLDLIQQAKPMIEERPMVREAVAPFVEPNTPPPMRYTETESQELLNRDWLFQCDNVPSPERIRNEIQWGVMLAARILAEPNADQNFLSQRIVELQRLKEKADRLSVTDEASRSLYLEVRKIKREIHLAHPVLDFGQILLVDMPYPAGSEWQHETRHRLGYMAVPGGQILVLNGLTPNQNVQRLMPQEPLHGSFWRPDLSFDGKRVLVSFKPHNEKAFHVYEINIDGTGLRQITSGMFDDLDPIYLPDGKNFVFSTTRGYSYVRCMPPTNAFVLARCALDGDAVYLISQNNEPDYLPSVLDDGRIIYTRWEYTDKPLWRCQSLWTLNPDGTQHNTFWGNQSVWPDLPKDARSIPGSRRVMFTGSAHHNWFAGSIGIIDPDRGINFPFGLTKVTADIAWPECGNGPVDPVESRDYHSSGNLTAYHSPYPLGEKDFLVSANKNGKFVLYLMDTDGNRELIYEGVHNIFHAIPVRKRMTPPVGVDRVDWPTFADRGHPQNGNIYSNNVYEGVSEELKGKAKFLRILHIEPKTYTLWDHRPYISTGPVVSMVQSEGVKRVLGTVPIEADGSVSFEAPAGVALHFQLLDENQLALQTMRSFTGVMPGETRGCLGCHERHSAAPIVQGETFSMAMKQRPQQIVPVPWAYEKKGEGQKEFVARNGTSISYVSDVLPVFQRYCIDCHSGDGEGKSVFDMTPRPGFLMFDEPYVTMIGAPNWGAPGHYPTGAWGGGKNDLDAKFPPGFDIAGTIPVEAYSTVDPAAYTTPKPMTSLSYKSRLIELASGGTHYDVKMDQASLLRLILWVDTMCPYIDDTQIRQMPDPKFQGSEWLSVRPRLETAPTVVRPGPFHAKQDDPTYD